MSPSAAQQSAQDEDDGCYYTSALGAPLYVGAQAQVTPGQANNVRSEPSLDAPLLGTIPPGGILTIVDGPRCSPQYRWWKVDYNGLIGWTVSATISEEWVKPLCASRFQLGESVEVMSEQRAEVYNQPTTADLDPIATLPAGQMVTLTDGPVCDGLNTWMRINADGTEGWIRESGYEYCDSPWCPDDGRPAPYLRYPLMRGTLLNPQEIAHRVAGEVTQMSLPAGAITPSNLSNLRTLNHLGDGDILDVIWSPDSPHFIVIGSVDMRIYDPLRLNEAPRILSQVTGTSSIAAYSPDGRTFVTADVQGRASLWDIEAGELRTTIAREGEITAIAFSDDSTYMAISTRDSIGLWRFDAYNQPALAYEFDFGALELRFLDGSPRFIALGDSGMRVVDPTGPAVTLLDEVTERTTYSQIESWDINPLTQTLDAILMVIYGTNADNPTYSYFLASWSIVSGEILVSYGRPYAIDTPRISSATVRYLPGTARRLLYVGDGLQIFQQDTGLMTNLSISDVTTLDVSPDGELIAVGTRAGAVQLFVNGQYLDVLHGVNGKVISLSFSQDGQLIAALGEDNAVRVWSVGERRRLGSVIYQTLDYPLGINANGTQLATRSQLWDLESGTVVATLNDPDASWGNEIVFRGDTPIMEYLSDGMITLKDLRSGAILTSFALTFDDTPLGYAFSPDLTVVAEVDVDSDPTAVTVFTRDVLSSREIGRLERYFYNVFPLDISPNGRLLALSGPNFGPDPKTLTLWDMTTRELFMERRMDDTPLNIELTNTALAYSETLTITEQGESHWRHVVRYADLATGRAWDFTLFERDILYELRFSPDGALLVGGGSLGYIYLWDVKSGKQLARIDAHSDSVFWIAFSEDGRRLATFGGEGVVKIWGIE
jgi:WD40 repeat protein